MKKLLLLSLALASSLFAQTPVNVQKGGAAGTNNITSDLNIGTGRTLLIASGGTLTVASGATFSFPAGTIPWTAITSTPTTLAGYGIADGVSTAGSYANPSWITSLAATKLTGTMNASQLPSFSGDISTSAGSSVTTLATVNGNVGSWGSATAVPTFTVNGKGLITAASNTTISIPSTAISDSTATGRALLTTASPSAARTTLGLATVAATGSYTDLINQPTFNSFSPMTTLGDIIYENATPAGARLAGNTTATNKFLTQVGNGSISAAPGWSVIANADVPTTLTGKTYNGLTPTALSTGFTIAGGTTSKTLTVPLDASVAGTNTGDQTISITGDVTASGSTGALASTVVKINGVSLGGLATGILKNTTTTGVPSIAVAGTDYQAPGSYITALTGDATATGPGSVASTVVKVNGVSYGTSPSTNTVPVVTGANTVTYQTVPNAALANSAVTIGSTSTSLGGTSATIAGLTLTAPVINGATSSGSTAINLSGNSGAFSSPTGANSLGGAVTVNDATTPSVTLASGKTNTGFYQVNGKTSGALKVTAADAAGQTVTINLAAQTTGAATLTIPDQAGTSRNLVTDTGAATLTNKTFGASNTVSTGFSYTAGVTQTFAPNATSSGLNVGSQAGVPSSLNNGDIFYDSTANALKARSNGSTIILGAGGSGTVTNTGGSLTANSVVLGAGTNDTKVVAGIITDGVSGVTLGVAGTSVGAVNFKNATSGTVTLQPVTGALGAVTSSLPAVTGTLVSSGDTGTVTNTMLAGSIANAKLTNSTVTIGSTSTALGATSASISGLTVVTPVISTGLTASGSTSNDFSGSTGTFKTSTGAGTFGGSSNQFTNGIKGVAGTGAAAAGNIGEYLVQTIASGSAVTLSSGTQVNIATITLTAGDWDVGGTLQLTANGTSIGYCRACITSSSATIDVSNRSMSVGATLTYPSGLDAGFAMPTTRFSVSGSTQIWLVIQMTFSGTQTAYGSIWARRAANAQ